MFIRGKKRIISIVIFLFIITLISIQSSVFSQEEKKVEAPVLGSNVNLKAAGLDLAKMTLVEHTFNCLADCHSVVEFTPLKDFTYDFDTVSGYYVNGTESNGVKSLTYTLQKEVTKTKQADIYGENCSNVVDGNGTSSEVCGIVKIGYENQTYTDYETLPFAGLKTFKAGENYRIRIDLKRQPKLGFNAVDWRLSFNGFEVPWAWFSSNYSFKRQINFTDYGVSNIPFLLNETGFKFSSTTQYAWGLSSNQSSLWIYYNNESDYVLVNSSESGQLPMEINSGNGTSFNPTQIWDNNYLFVWHLEDNANDSGRFGHAAQIGTFNQSVGKYGGGASGYGLGVNNNAIYATDDFTIEYWAKPGFSDGTYNSLISARGTSGANRVILSYDAVNKQFHFEVMNGISPTYIFTTNTVTLEQGQWYHIVAAYDGNPASVTIYVNGTSIGGSWSPSAPPSLIVTDFNRNMCFWGGDDNCPGSTKKWDIDEVRYSNITRSAQYVNATYNQLKSQFGVEQYNNNAPNTPDISYDVSSAYNYTNLNCSSATGISDPDGNDLTVFFNLSVDGIQKSEQILTNQANGSRPSWVIAAANYSKNQTVKCNITLYDGSLYSDTNSTSIVISNSVPVVESYNSSSLNRTEINYTNQRNVTFQENETVRLGVNVSDEDTSDSHWYSWFVDDSQEQSSGNSWLDWVWDLFSSGLHTVRVVINDSSNENVSHQWNVNVVNVINKYWSLSFVSPTPDDNANLSSASVNISVQVSPSLLEASVPLSVFHNGSTDFIGTFSSTELNSSDESVQLSYANLTGNYTSNVYDAGTNVTWSSLSWGQYLPSNGELEPEAGLVGLWHMNEDSGEILDYSGYLNNGTALGVTYGVSGKHYTALSFDGVLGNVNVSDSNILDFTNTLTLEAWIKTSTANKGIMYKGTDGVQGEYGLALDGSGRLILVLKEAVRATGTTALNDGNWHHVAGTYDKNAGGVTEAKVYVDGVLDSTGDFSQFLVANTNNLKIGRYISSAYSFNGVIDEVAVWNITLNSSEILKHYNSKITNVSFQARSCDDSLCSGESFVGPNGVNSYFVNEAAESLGNLAVNRYFQYKAYLETNSAGFTPKLFNVTVLGDTVAVYSNANTSQVWIDLNGENVTMTGSNNLYSYVNNSLTVGEYNYRVYSNDSYGNVNFTEARTFRLQNYNITFNVTDGDTDRGLNNTGINCNYSGFSQGGDSSNAYGPYAFPVGNWECTFNTTLGYYSKTEVFTVDSNQFINIILEVQKDMTKQEHDWLRDVYECIINGDCNAYRYLQSINQTVGKIWEEFLPTDRTVVTQEKFISNTLSSSQNLSINYSLSIPFKEGYAEGDLLPIRIFFWFTDVNKTKCYNQDKQVDANNVASPFCVPLVATYLGPNNGSVNFVVDLHPNLPAGTYNVTRSIDIDPIENHKPIWINYGREVIEGIYVLDNSMELTTINSDLPRIETKGLNGLVGITGSTIKEDPLQLLNNLKWIFLLTVLIICITIITTSYLKSKG